MISPFVTGVLFGATATIIVQIALLFILAAVFVGRDEVHSHE